MKRNSSTRTNSKTSKGFSLLELMISMALFGLGLLSMVSSLVEANSLLASTGVKNKALLLASSRKEIMKVKALDIAEREYLEARWLNNLDKNLDDVQSKVTVLSGKQVVVSLFWPGNKFNPACKTMGNTGKSSEKGNTIDCLRL